MKKLILIILWAFALGMLTESCSSAFSMKKCPAYDSVRPDNGKKPRRY